jgi:hypothetical protein
LGRIHLEFGCTSGILVQNVIFDIVFNIRWAFLAQTSERKFIGAHWGPFCLIRSHSASYLSVVKHWRFSTWNLRKSCAFAKVLFIGLQNISYVQIFSGAAYTST